jgi:hypothetical protein
MNTLRYAKCLADLARAGEMRKVSTALAPMIVRAILVHGTAFYAVNWVKEAFLGKANEDSATIVSG